MKLTDAIVNVKQCVPTIEDAEQRLQQIADFYVAAASAIGKAKKLAETTTGRLERSTGLTGIELDCIVADLPSELAQSLDAAAAECPELLDAARAALGDVDQVFDVLRSEEVVSWRG